MPEKVFLKSWELVELPNLVMRPDKDGRKMALRITATITQCSTDVFITGGVTNALRMMQYAKDHPPLVINLHWAWMPQAHLAMACDEKLMPLVEFPMGEDFPKSLLDGPHLLAPDWPGIYKLD